MVVVKGNPKDSMKSTWRETDPKTWTLRHRHLARVDNWHNDNNDYPKFAKTEPVRWMSIWSVNRWILTHSAWPFAVQALLNYITGVPLHPYFMVVLYSIAFKANGFGEVVSLRKIATETGFLDGDKASRDKVPDVGIDKVFNSLQAITFVRPVMTVILAYKRSAPIAVSPWLPIELAIYAIVLDFFFYTYHRATHELDGLWKYHRTHHLTKHPHPLLSSYADLEQEIIELGLIPLFTFATLKLMGFPMGFYDFWICQSYTFFAEAYGHCGVRAMLQVPGPAGILLKPLDCELIVEDHDLHHRQGWRKSGNYGKATRLWDRLFGTCINRVECQKDNIDYENTLRMPLVLAWGHWGWL